MAENEGTALQFPTPGRTAMAAGLDEVVRCQELVRDLRCLLVPGDTAEELAGMAVEALTRGLALLRAVAAVRTSTTMAEKQYEDGRNFLHLPQLSPTATSPCDSGATEASSGGFRRQRSGGTIGGAEKKAGQRRRSHPYACKEITLATLEDGYTWRKYGQKDIQNSSEPRSYYRCTYKKSRGCQATRQAQKHGDGSGVYSIIYFGEHTCNLPAAAPHNQNNQIENQQTRKVQQGTRLISFVAEAGAAASQPTAAFQMTPLKQEADTLTSDKDHLAGGTSSNDVVEAVIMPEPSALPRAFPGFYHRGADTMPMELLQGYDSTGLSSPASGVSRGDMECMDDDVCYLRNLIDFDNMDHFLTFPF